MWRLFFHGRGSRDLTWGSGPQLNQLCDLSCLVELLSRRLALVDPTLWDFGCSEELRLEVGHFSSLLSRFPSHLLQCNLSIHTPASSFLLGNWIMDGI